MKEKDFCKLLDFLKDNDDMVVISNGLASDEYIKYEKGKGFLYEDNCFIGIHAEDVYNLLFNELGWAKDKKFYICHISCIQN